MQRSITLVMLLIKIAKQYDTLYNTKIGEGRTIGLEALYGESKIEEIQVECFERNSFDIRYTLRLRTRFLRTFG